MMRVIGVDPGLRNMGWGIVDTDGVRLRHVANGVCASTTGEDLSRRLAELFRQLDAVLEEHRPVSAAVEQTFVNKDAAGTLKLGQARGVAMLAPSLRNIPVAEYAPNAVKKAVVGVGHAQKPQIQHMIGVLLPGVKPAGPDAADALAIAICHAYSAGALARREAAETAALKRRQRA